MRRLAARSAAASLLSAALVLGAAGVAEAFTTPEESAVATRALPRLHGAGAVARPVPAALDRDEAGAADPAATRRVRAESALARLGGAAAAPAPEAGRWSAWTGLPHRLWTRGLAVPGRDLGDAAAAEAAARAFLAAEPALWAGEDRPAAGDLALAKAHRVGGTWFLVFRQRHQGLDVEGGRVDLRLRADGTIALFGSDWFPGVRLPAAPRIPLGVADARARLDLGFVAARDRALDGRTVVVPLPGADGSIDYRLAHRVRHRLADPPALWTSWIDATTGETLGRENEVRHVTLAGTAWGQVHPATPTDPLELRPFRDEVVAVTADSAFSGATGAYTLPGVTPGATVRTALRGRYLEVIHAALAEAAQSAAAPSSGPLDFTWTPANSDTAERDAYYHAHVAHDHLKALDPGFTALDYRMPCVVNIGNQCNAFWDGTGINFYRWGLRPSDGRSCANTGQIADVVYHEYGHGRTQEVWAPFAPSGAMHEGLSDYLAATITGQPLIGRGFFGPGTNIRTTANTQRIDEASCLGAVHCVGNAISGALWDLRGRLVAAAGTPAEGVRLADSLFHFAGYGGAEWHDDYLLDLLVVDDDDATLLNGTPHFADICAAFTPRGIDCPAITGGVWFVHAALPDAPLGAGAFTVDAQVGSFAGGFDAASPTLSWRVGGGLLHDVTMTALGGGAYRAQIPPMPAGGHVEYLLRARDLGAGEATSPPGAPATLHSFHVGTLATAWADDFETDRGWTGSIAGATTGRWMRVDPNGTFSGGNPPFWYAPEDDHTPGAGTFCFVTHDTTAGLGQGSADIDDGCVTLVSPLIDLTGVDNARLEYWRWFVDETRYDDTLSVAVTADGGATWVELERVVRTAEGWQSRAFDLGRFVALPAQVRLRLRTCDGGGGSLLEAALDDVRITTRTYGAVSAGGEPGEDDIPAVAFLARPAPNPLRSGQAAAIVFGVPAVSAGPGGVAAAVRLDIVDVRGRVVRTLADGPLPPGRHAVRWDGTDDRGARAPSGVYFVRFATHGGSRRAKLVRLD